jgi:hypothetical protein
MSVDELVEGGESETIPEVAMVEDTGAGGCIPQLFLVEWQLIEMTSHRSDKSPNAHRGDNSSNALKG